MTKDNKIIDNSNLVNDDAFDCRFMEATSAKPTGLSFHIGVNDIIEEDLTSLIIEATARQLLNRANENKISKKVEDKIIDELISRSDKVITGIAEDVYNKKMTKENWYDKDTQTIGDSFKKITSEYFSRTQSSGKTKLDDLVSGYITRDLENALIKEREELKQELISEIRNFQTAYIAQQKLKIKAKIDEAMAVVNDIKPFI